MITVQINKISYFSILTRSLVIFFVFCLLGSHSAWAKRGGKSLKDAPKYQRIVSLKPNLTYILQSLGLGDRIVGITKFCPKPNQSAQVVGDYNSINVETILRLKPDLILSSSENSQSRQFEALKSARLNARLFEFRNYTEMKSSLLAMADLLGVSVKGRAVVADMEKRLQALKLVNQTQSAVPKLFIVMVQRHPLMVASGNTFISSLLQQTGMKNAFGVNKIAYPVLDEEEFIREIVDYTFEMSHKGEAEGGEFLNKTITPIDIKKFLATPQSIGYLEELINRLNKSP